MKDSVYLFGFLIGAAVLLLLGRDQLPSSILLTWGLTFGATTAAAVLMVSLYRVQLELKRSRNELARKNAEIDFAKQVQRALFPADTPSGYGVGFSAICIPAQGISGDYYDMIPGRPEEIIVVVADVSGKGISAAILMANVQARLHALAETFDRLDALAGKLSRDLYRVTEANKFATAFLSCWKKEERTLTYVNAGHLKPIVIGNEAPDLHCGGPPLGMFEAIDYQMGRVRLNPGDLVALYSDGISEAGNSEGEEYGAERLERILTELAGEPLQDIRDEVLNSVRMWTSDDTHDDMTIVLMRVQES